MDRRGFCGFRCESFLWLLFPCKENGQAVENESINDNVDAEYRHSNDHFKDVWDLLVKLPVESNKCCVQAIQDNSEDGDKRTQPGQFDNSMANGIGEENDRQHHTDGHFKQIPGSPTSCQVTPLVIMGNTD